MEAARSLSLSSVDETIALATHVAPGLRAGDCLLLHGPVGAGKTAFARALIQARQSQAGRPLEDVPSPSFTLIQTYDVGDLEIWHADLYRLTDPSEVLELGLDEALSSAASLIEWPDRLGEIPPKDAVHLHFGVEGEGRSLTIEGPRDHVFRLFPHTREGF